VLLIGSYSHTIASIQFIQLKQKFKYEFSITEENVIKLFQASSKFKYSWN